MTLAGPIRVPLGFCTRIIQKPATFHADLGFLGAIVLSTGRNCVSDIYNQHKHVLAKEYKITQWVFVLFVYRILLSGGSLSCSGRQAGYLSSEQRGPDPPSLLTHALTPR